jgi:DNA-binding transcriptional MerR regulator
MKLSCRLSCLCWSLLTLTVCGQQPSAAIDRSELLLVVGAAGQEDYGRDFGIWADRWQQAAEQGGAAVTVIGRSAAAGGEATVTDRDAILAAITRNAGTASAEPLWIVFLGHGTFDQRESRWNLRGPDLSASELAEACQSLQRPLVAVICASCSAPFLNALSGPGRCIVTATKDGNQLQYSRFGDFMSTAIAGLEADIDRDGQTSLLEAWLYAARRTAQFYTTEGRLATEHSLLDDNGDQQGVRSEIFHGLKPSAQIKADKPIDGQRAGNVWLVLSPQERQLSREQRQQRDQLEAELEQLKQKKDQQSETEYLQQLEAILLQLARLYQTATEHKTPNP